MLGFMSPAFQIVALPSERFRPLFALSDEQLRAAGARRIVVDEKPGAPCRVSLVDAEPGETVLLLHFVHHDVDTPYRASGPIFVRESACTASPGVNELPEMVLARPQSVRAYDRSGMLVASDVVEGAALAASVRRMFADERVHYLHLHNARPGCFNCRVERVFA
jgi:hypothetical protein